MSLRYIMRNGERVLQFKGDGFIQWYDVPTVEEPKKPREWDVYLDPNGAIQSYSAYASSCAKVIKVREVLDE